MGSKMMTMGYGEIMPEVEDERTSVMTKRQENRNSKYNGRDGILNSEEQ